MRNPGAQFEHGDYQAFRAGRRLLARRYFPYKMAIKMLLKPLGLGGTVWPHEGPEAQAREA